MEKIRYSISYHAIERIVERFGEFCNRNSEFKGWTREKGLNSVRSSVDSIITNSEINKSLFNNSAFMVSLYDKYGYDVDYIFAENQKENMLLIFKKPREKDIYHLMTVMPSSYKPLAKNTKYNDKIKKEEKEKQNILDIYDKIKDLRENTAKRISKNNVETVTPNEELEQILISKVRNQEAIVLEKLSNTKNKVQVILSEKEYNFIYKKGENAKIEDLVVIPLDEKIKEELLHQEKLNKYLTPEIRNKILLSIDRKQTKFLEKVSNNLSLHEIQIDNYNFHIQYAKNTKNLEVKDVKPRLEKKLAL